MVVNSLKKEWLVRSNLTSNTTFKGGRRIPTSGACKMMVYLS